MDNAQRTLLVQNPRSRADEGMSKPKSYIQSALNPRSVNPNFEAQIWRRRQNML